ncbi:IS200/IS605 family transposase [Desulfovirgula thermocuniculi]|uniref:IS200/IS605 family transposase n=1 Tax=Desulfovirgula thermocuniculi TaxID=348842 RepID=UPI0003FA1860|nr:IS200/IS605 family transposase [Desulfovirgula thermocuniculi]
MKTKKTRYAHYNINYHFVWIPKYRRKILVGPVAEELERLIRKVCDEREVEVLSLSIQPDHVHLFVSAPPRHAPSVLINTIKGYTSRYLRQKFPELSKQTGPRLWTRTYYVGTAGTVSAETIQRYIAECQDE